MIGVRRVWLRTAGLLVLLVLVSASCNLPGATALTGRETVGGQVEFEGGVIQRQVRVSMSAGALEGAEDGFAGFGVSTRAAAPMVDVVFGGPVDGDAIVDRQGNYGFTSTGHCRTTVRRVAR